MAEVVMKTGKRGWPAHPWTVGRSDAVRLAEEIAGTQQSTNIFLTIKNSSCKFLMRIMFTLRLLRILMTIAYNHRLEFCKVENNAHTRERAAHWCAELQTVEKESFVATRRSDARHIFTGQSEAESVLHSECVSK